MKELRYNIQYLLKRRELYFSTIVVLAINLIHVILCVNESLRLNSFIEHSYTAEYQFILYNSQVALNILVIIALPIAFSLIFSDTSWLDKKDKTLNLLYTRLNYKKNIFVRLCLSIIVTFIISFIGFFINYLLLRLIYGSGNNITYFQSLAFNLERGKSWFLDDLRMANPVAFIYAINCTVSISLGLLSGLSYLLSFFVKQRVIIYFTPVIFLIMTELIFPIIGLEGISFINMLQPFSKLSFLNYLFGTLILVCMILIILLKNMRKKDVLV